MSAYQPIIERLLTLHPKRIDLSLDRMWRILAALGHPQRSLAPVIHVAGTNGKGSVCALVERVLRETGVRTGLFTSPHLVDFRERIRINGKMISEKEVVSFIEKYRSDFERISPSFFEWTVALAFDYFAREKVDVAVIETGLGGRLDSTNVITPLLSVITNIGLDHTNLLGDTLEKIAGEKAGIIKKNIPVVIGESQSETKNIFSGKADALNSQIVFADEIFEVMENHADENHLSLHIFRDGKIYLENTNLQFALSPSSVNPGTLRETFLLNQLRSAGHAVGVPAEGDFRINEEFTVEVGGKDKTAGQLGNRKKAYVVADDIETGVLNKIPLWLFGFMY